MRGWTASIFVILELKRDVDFSVHSILFCSAGIRCDCPKDPLAGEKEPVCFSPGWGGCYPIYIYITVHFQQGKADIDPLSFWCLQRICWAIHVFVPAICCLLFLVTWVTRLAHQYALHIPVRCQFEKPLQLRKSINNYVPWNTFGVAYWDLYCHPNTTQPPLPTFKHCT